MADPYLLTGALVLGALAATAAAAGPAGPDVQRRAILDVSPAAPHSVSRIEASTVSFGPGQASGRHMHPHPVVGVVAQGSFILQVKGQAPLRLNPGDGFYEPADVTILRFDNASSVEPATMTAFYLVGDRSRPTIVMLPER